MFGMDAKNIKENEDLITKSDNSVEHEEATTFPSLETSDPAYSVVMECIYSVISNLLINIDNRDELVAKYKRNVQELKDSSIELQQLEVDNMEALHDYAELLACLEQYEEFRLANINDIDIHPLLSPDELIDTCDDYCDNGMRHSNINYYFIEANYSITSVFSCEPEDWGRIAAERINSCCNDFIKFKKCINDYCNAMSQVRRLGDEQYQALIAFKNTKEASRNITQNDIISYKKLLTLSTPIAYSEDVNITISEDGSEEANIPNIDEINKWTAHAKKYIAAIETITG